MFPRLAVLLLSPLFLSCQKQTPAPDPTATLPLLPDSSAKTWPAEAWQAEVLNPKPASQPPNPTRLALAWQPDGLRLWAEVKDATPCEAADAPSIWRGDSMELFIDSPYGSGNWVQLLVAPGRIPDHPAPRWHRVDHQKDPSPGKDPVVEAQVRGDGYSLSVFFPWKNLAHPPKEGDSIGVQVYFNNAAGLEGKTRLVLYPSENNQESPQSYLPMRLGQKAGPPQKVLAMLEVEKLSRLQLKVWAAPDMAGEKVEVRAGPGAAWTALGKLDPARDGMSLASLPLPGSASALPGKKLELRIGSRSLPALDIPDLREARLNALRNCSVVANPSVFGGPALPRVDFLNKDLVETVFGPCAVKVRYFNSAYEEVKTAVSPGRYGALVEIQTADGLRDTRRITLFHTAKPYEPKNAKYGIILALPAEFGLPADLAQTEAQAAHSYLDNQLHAQAKTNLEWAALLAGLSDAARRPRELHGIDFGRLNFEWWAGLDKALGTLQPYPYLITLPGGYDSDPGKQWPLLVFLHGAGERGADLNLVKKHGPPKLIEAGRSFPFIVVSPQCPLGEGWSALKVNEFVDQIRLKYRVDPKRIVVTGLSMGGGGSLYLAAYYPEKYAAIAPICGNTLSDLAPRLATTPLWAFNGDKDTEALPERIQSLVQAVNRAGGRARLTLYPGVGHASWEQAYNDPELYEWLLQQHK